MLIQNGGQSVTQMRLELAPYGSLEGKVIKGGAPEADVRIGVSSLTSPDVTFGVASGADGNFRFDRLAPDDYKVSAMVGASPMRGFGFQAQKVTVTSGKTTKATITLSTGDIELAVAIVETAGKPLNFTWVTAVRGQVAAENARQLQLEIGRQPEGYSAQAFSIAGMAATVRNLDTGTCRSVELPILRKSQGCWARWRTWSARRQPANVLPRRHDHRVAHQAGGDARGHSARFCASAARRVVACRGQSAENALNRSQRQE